MKSEQYARHGASVRAYRAAFTDVGRAVDIIVGQSLLDAALAGHLPFRHTCGAGACGDCRVRIGEGAVETEDSNNLLTPGRAQPGLDAGLSNLSDWRCDGGRGKVALT